MTCGKTSARLSDIFAPASPHCDLLRNRRLPPPDTIRDTGFAIYLATLVGTHLEQVIGARRARPLSYRVTFMEARNVFPLFFIRNSIYSPHKCRRSARARVSGEFEPHIAMCTLRDPLVHAPKRTCRSCQRYKRQLHNGPLKLL